MADLNDLPIVSIADASTDEALELLRQIRLSRRVPVKKEKTPSQTRKAKAKVLPSVSLDEALNLLKILGENK